MIIQGKITDKYNDALEGASIYIQNNSKIGTTSNYDGSFFLEKDNISINDNVVISYLGYFKKTIPVNSFINKKLTIKLSPNVEELDEIVVTSSSPKSSLLSGLFSGVKSAINNTNIETQAEPTIEVKQTVFQKYKKPIVVVSGLAALTAGFFLIKKVI